MDGYTLIVQAKLRSGDAWTVSALNTLLTHGGERRQSAEERLSAGNVRYLLVTSAGLNGKTRGLNVRRAGSWPNAESMPASMAKLLPPGSAGRVAVIGNEDEERLERDIRQLLTESFRVPNARWQECLRNLREQTRVRVLGGDAGRWRREALEETIRIHQGYIAQSPELDRFVYPSIWGDLRTAMDERHAALIIGQSGTGKTMATLKLYEELRQVIPGLERVPITLGPTQLTNDSTESPVLYDIEDPWGRFDFLPESRPWNDQLPLLFSQARHDRLMVATSRRDVAKSSEALEELKRWIVPLEVDHYGEAERNDLYRSRIGLLPRNLQEIARASKDKVLSELGTPLEIQKFFDALVTLDRERLANTGALILEAIRTAHKNAIERTVVEQIEQRNDVCAAAILWGLLIATDRLSLSVVRMIEEELANQDRKMTIDVSSLIQFFVAARNLRQMDDSVAYYHPRVEAGIERALVRDRLIVRSTLMRLVEVLTSATGLGDEWGTAAAAKLLAAAAKIAELKVAPKGASSSVIDAWIEKQVTRGGDEFKADLNLASVVGSPESNLSEVARYLVNRRDRNFPGIFEWVAPDREEVWYSRMRDDSETKPLIEAFIRNVLPSVHGSYGKSFAIEVERLAVDLSNAFVDAALSVAHMGFFPALAAIVEGALRNLDGCEAVVDKAVETVSQLDEDRPEVASEHLAIVNREYSEDHAQMLIEDDQGAASYEFLDAYVGRIRTTRGWRHLVHHRHFKRFVSCWLKQLANEESWNTEEVDGAFVASYGGRHEALLWFVVEKAWERRFLESLRARMREGHENREIRQAALSCLIEHERTELVALCKEKADCDEVARLVEIAIDLGKLRNGRSSQDGREKSAASRALELLPGIVVELSDGYVAISQGQSPTLSVEARATLANARGGDVDVRRFRVLCDGTMPLDIEDDIRWLLANASESKIAVEATEAAIRRGLTAEVEAALDHQFAAVSAVTLTSIGELLNAPLPERLLVKAKAKGSPIRMALASLLESKPHEQHVATLLVLAGDTWSNREFYYEDDVSFPIAQTAVEAMGKVGWLTSDCLEQLYGIAIASPDYVLCGKIFELLAKKGEQIYQEKLFDLAVRPGRDEIRGLASFVLLRVRAVVAPEVVARITGEILKARSVPASVSANLALLLAWRADPNTVRAAADVLAVEPNRRALLLLLIRAC